MAQDLHVPTEYGEYGVRLADTGGVPGQPGVSAAGEKRSFGSGVV